MLCPVPVVWESVCGHSASTSTDAVQSLTVAICFDCHAAVQQCLTDCPVIIPQSALVCIIFIIPVAIMFVSVSQSRHFFFFLPLARREVS